MRLVLLISLLSYFNAFANIPDKCTIKGFYRPEWSKSEIVSVSEQSNDLVSLKIYPNPVIDYLRIELNCTKGNSVDIRIVNLIGQNALSISGIEIQQGKLDHQIKNEIKSLKPGLYILKVYTETTYHSKFFIKI